MYTTLTFPREDIGHVFEGNDGDIRVLIGRNMTLVFPRDAAIHLVKEISSTGITGYSDRNLEARLETLNLIEADLKMRGQGLAIREAHINAQFEAFEKRVAQFEVTLQQARAVINDITAKTEKCVK